MEINVLSYKWALCIIESSAKAWTRGVNQVCGISNTAYLPWQKTWSLNIIHKVSSISQCNMELLLTESELGLKNGANREIKLPGES